jgi:hypothetical protein
MMKTLRNFTALGVGAGLLTLVAASPAPAAPAQHQERKVILPSGHALFMSSFYADEAGSVGEFPGRLLCMRMNREPIGAPTDQCDKKDHVYVLAMHDSMVHPLLAGDPQTLDKLPGLVGKKVVVEGNYYESIGMVLATKIRAGA